MPLGSSRQRRRHERPDPVPAADDREPSPVCKSAPFRGFLRNECRFPVRFVLIDSPPHAGDPASPPHAGTRTPRLTPETSTKRQAPGRVGSERRRGVCCDSPWAAQLQRQQRSQVGFPRQHHAPEPLRHNAPEPVRRDAPEPLRRNAPEPLRRREIPISDASGRPACSAADTRTVKSGEWCLGARLAGSLTVRGCSWRLAGPHPARGPCRARRPELDPRRRTRPASPSRLGRGSRVPWRSAGTPGGWRVGIRRAAPAGPAEPNSTRAAELNPRPRVGRPQPARAGRVARGGRGARAGRGARKNLGQRRQQSSLLAMDLRFREGSFAVRG